MLSGFSQALAQGAPSRFCSTHLVLFKERVNISLRIQKSPLRVDPAGGHEPGDLLIDVMDDQVGLRQVFAGEFLDQAAGSNSPASVSAISAVRVVGSYSGSTSCAAARALSAPR